MRQDFDCGAEDVFFDHDGLQGRLDATALQLLNTCNTFTMEHERLEKHSGRSATSHARVESLLSSSVSCFVNAVSCFVNDEIAANRARGTSVVA